MKLALELEFPDEQAANVLRLLQSMPDVTARILTNSASVEAEGAAAELSATEQQRLVHELFGSWQSDENGEELARQIQEARHSRNREVEL
jgi:hypothetical protein